MDGYEATKVVFSRIQSLDKENAAKIMGLLLLQDSGEKEMIRLAFAPESLLHSVVHRARNDLAAAARRPELLPPPPPLTIRSPTWAPPSPEDELSPVGEQRCRHKVLMRSNSARIGSGVLHSPTSSPTSRFLSFYYLHRQQQQQQNESQRSSMAALILAGSDIDAHKKFIMHNQYHPPFMTEVASMAANSGERQIYLTFPADSTFREEDVSNYFSIYGPVHDVRIPYQQKRMFGFVAFVFPETVKLILSKGNPHFVCDARVLVKPYKEKNKVLPADKYRKLQQGDRSDFSGCSTPTGIEHYKNDGRNFSVSDLFHGQNTDGNLFEAEAAAALFRLRMERQLVAELELQRRRLMGLDFADLNPLPMSSSPCLAAGEEVVPPPEGLDAEIRSKNHLSKTN